MKKNKALYPDEDYCCPGVVAGPGMDWIGFIPGGCSCRSSKEWHWHRSGWICDSCYQKVKNMTNEVVCGNQ